MSICVSVCVLIIHVKVPKGIRHIDYRMCEYVHIACGVVVQKRCPFNVHFIVILLCFIDILTLYQRE